MAFVVIGLLVLANVVLYSLNYGHDVGYTSGYNQAILDGKVEIMCKFKCKNGGEREKEE